MSDPKFVIDKNDIVHAGYCNVKGDYCIPYVATRMALDDNGKPSLRPVVGYQEMYVHLTTPDSSGNGIGGWAHHEGPARIKPCPMCIPAEVVA